MSTTIGPELDDATRARLQRLFDFLADINFTAAAEAIRLIRSGADRRRDHPRPGRPHLGRPTQDGLRRALQLPFAGGANSAATASTATPPSSSAFGIGAGSAAERAPPASDAAAADPDSNANLAPTLQTL